MKGGERNKAARPREMRLSSLHVRGINDEHRHQASTAVDQRPIYEDGKIASYINWPLNSFQNAQDITYHQFILSSIISCYMSVTIVKKNFKRPN